MRVVDKSIKIDKQLLRRDLQCKTHIERSKRYIHIFNKLPEFVVTSEFAHSFCPSTLNRQIISILRFFALFKIKN